MLEEGKVFKNFKELCVFMEWIDKETTLSTCSKRKYEKSLSQICSWEKINGTNKILIKEIYKQRKKRIDGRSSRSKYIKPIESILMYELMQNRNKNYLSINAIGEMLGIYNEKFKEDSKFYSKLAFENYIEEYLVSIFLFNSKGEINRIIKRAMKSMITNGAIEAEEGIIIFSCKDGYKMASKEESMLIETIENNALRLLECKNKGFLNMKKLNKKFKQIVKDNLSKLGYEYVEYYYSGYFIKEMNHEISKEIDNSNVYIMKRQLKELILNRLKEYGLRINANAVRKEYKKLTFGEPMLVDTISNSNFIGDWNWLVDYFIDD